MPKSHIHRLTEEDIVDGLVQPRERKREITDRYTTFEQAIVVSFQDLGIVNLIEYFPGLQMRMFDGYC